MPLTYPNINKAVDVDTFAQLADAIAARLPSVPSQRYTGEQRLNSLVDAVTVDTLASHYKAAAGDSTPTNTTLDSDRINSTKDVYRLENLVAYLKTKGISVAVPVNSVAPVITGSGNGPFTVSNNGTWSNSPDSFTFQWYRGAGAVSGATTNTLPSNAANVGQSITCRVAGVNEAGAGTPVASNAIVGA